MKVDSPKPRKSRSAQLGRLWRTLRHLRPRQFYGRLWFLLPRLPPAPRPAPPRRSRSGPWVAPVEHAASLVGPARFRFLGSEEDLSDIGWDGPGAAKLWRYNQHYFADLTAEEWSSRSEWHRSLMAAWIAANPPGRGSGWEPYPTSLRIVNWIKWALAGNQLSAEALASLATQARWLTRRIEWHLLANHLFINGKALVFAGLFFDGREADHWLAKGTAILARQAAEQILPDGGHFELSPMYHALIAEDLLDLVNIARTYGQDDLVTAWAWLVPNMLAWLATMTHPDGDIAFFNDSAFGIAAPLDRLDQYALRLGHRGNRTAGPLRHLPDSGYFRLSIGDFVTIGDVGRVGPDYQAGHAHADTLSFELSFGKQRVFVNSGISEYGAGPERQRQRGTAAHNTVILADENSSEVWSGFRVGRRARPSDVLVDVRGDRLHAEAAHDGYRHLAGAPRVWRSFDLDERGLTIRDSISPPYRSEAHFHLHPAIKIAELSAGHAALLLPCGRRLRLELEGGLPSILRTSWHPEFGVTQPNLCLVLPLAGGRAQLKLTAS